MDWDIADGVQPDTGVALQWAGFQLLIVGVGTGVADATGSGLADAEGLGDGLDCEDFGGVTLAPAATGEAVAVTGEPVGAGLQAAPMNMSTRAHMRPRRIVMSSLPDDRATLPATLATLTANRVRGEGFAPIGGAVVPRLRRGPRSTHRVRCWLAISPSRVQSLLSGWIPRAARGSAELRANGNGRQAARLAPGLRLGRGPSASN
jgi:hypothetical protein